MSTQITCRPALARFAGFFFGVIAVLLLFLAQSRAGHAATITVNTTDDELNSDGDCSLREAIQAANTNTGVDACTVSSGVNFPTSSARLSSSPSLARRTRIVVSGDWWLGSIAHRGFAETLPYPLTPCLRQVNHTKTAGKPTQGR